MREIHRRTHSVSHFQVDLVAKGSPFSEPCMPATPVLFAPGHIKVATAWDDNGRSMPFVEIAITLDDGAAPDFTGLVALAEGPFEAADAGLETGNFITGDTAALSLPRGLYRAVVLVDTLEAMSARRVHFHLLMQE